LFLSLGNECLQERHWQEIFKLLKVNNISKFSFKELLSLGLLEIREQVEEISSRAQGEAFIELQLNNIRKKWSELSFVVEKFLDS